MHENNGERYKNEVVNDFPNIVNDHVGDAAICDFRLLIQFIMKVIFMSLKRYYAELYFCSKFILN
jgi:hypothetical protein